METTGSYLSADSLLGLAKFAIELFNPNHKLATHNLEEIFSAFKHDFRITYTRLKVVTVPQQVLSGLISLSSCRDCLIDEEAFAIVGLKAASMLGVPVGGTTLGFASKCVCPVVSRNECSSGCKPFNQHPRSYSLQIASNRRVPPYQILVNEIVYHNIKTALYGSLPDSVRTPVLCLRRPDQISKGSKFALRYASKAVVSWVEQPLVMDSSIFSACLNGYFQVPHHLHGGDVFKVELSKYAPEVPLAPGKFAMKDVYFLVKSIDGENYSNVRNSSESIGFLIAKGETTLVQDINVHCFLPSSTLSSISTLSSLVPKYPEGLKKVYDMMIKISLPFLRGTSPGLKPAFLLTGPAGCGKRSLVSSVAEQLGMNFWSIDCAEIRGGTAGQTVGKLKAVMSKAKQYVPCITLFSNVQVLCKDQDGNNDFRVQEELEEQLLNLKDLKLPIIIFGTTETSTNVSPAFARLFLLEISIPALEKEERKVQLAQLMAQHNIATTDTCLEEAASRSSGFLLGDLNELVSLALSNNLCNRSRIDETPVLGNNFKATLTDKDFSFALDKMQSAYAGSIGAPKIPSVKWSDVGGLETVKKDILQTVTMPLKHPELTSGGLGRSGILLYGPPGTGKTLLAKAVATECNLNFLSVKGPELLNMYVGQSEANVREIFERAREASPCIIFFDELDALAPNRGKSGDSGGVMDRVVSQLLSEMDGLNKSALLFVIGATNRPDLIDPALLRPGRFDKLLYVGAYEDAHSKMSVLSALTRKFKLSSTVNLEEVSRKLPAEVTGADMYAVCSGAWLGAVRRVIKTSQMGTETIPNEVEVNQEDFLEAISCTNPSVSADDMLYFKGLQKQMSATQS
ncbi:Peroxisome assembly factor 2 [Frankliniella fusca]|uniref:Peroxisomal ATPase PEX6 n=1 Tax=Frankliniella fusca TaxID=407009 RepID=A0AAE1HQ40_9NEOP|nr:Peroxisome assembly factor 2 [Frankliniella fusca]